MTKIHDLEVTDNKNSIAIKGKQFRIVGGGILLWTPPNLTRSRRRPCVTTGSFSNGTPCINFRQFSEQGPGLLAPTRDGISLTISELNEVVEKIRTVFAETISVEDGAFRDSASRSHAA